MITYYAAWQKGGPIYGIGTTEHEAYENAGEWVDKESGLDTYFDGDPDLAPYGVLVTVPCSAKLAKSILTEGWSETMSVEIDDGFLVLSEEL